MDKPEQLGSRSRQESSRCHVKSEKVLLFKKRVIGTYSAMDGCVKVETTSHFLDETRCEQNC